MINSLGKKHPGGMTCYLVYFWIVALLLHTYELELRKKKEKSTRSFYFAILACQLYI